METKPEESDELQFDWIQIHKEIDANSHLESQKEKLIRKVKENPFVPVGCLATVAALSFGLWSFRTGKKKMSQYMMRTRIAAQGFTVFALILGLSMSAKKTL